jgi:hypothetical protein
LAASAFSRSVRSFALRKGPRRGRWAFSSPWTKADHEKAVTLGLVKPLPDPGQTRRRSVGRWPRSCSAASCSARRDVPSGRAAFHGGRCSAPTRSPAAARQPRVRPHSAGPSPLEAPSAVPASWGPIPRSSRARLRAPHAGPEGSLPGEAPDRAVHIQLKPSQDVKGSGAQWGPMSVV